MKIHERDVLTRGKTSLTATGHAVDRLTIVSRPLSLFSPKALARKCFEFVTGRERYATHRALMQYTIAGLRKTGHRPIYDPVMRFQCSKHVIIMGFDENLGWAVRARQSGRLRFLGLGPMMANANRKELLRLVPIQSFIDRIFNASDRYRKRCCEEAPELAHLFTTWSCGVDTDYWTPGNHKSRDRPRVVVYQKNAPEDVLNGVLETLSRFPMEPCVLKYGTYGPTDFRLALQSATYAVFLSKWEAQGIAMAEAWSCGVPTFIWRSSPDSKEPYSAPLLTSSTGEFFHDSLELYHHIQRAQNGIGYRPREWVLQNLSSEGQAFKLLELCGLPFGASSGGQNADRT